MENIFELKIINTMMIYGKILKEKGYLVKIKFWGVDNISLNDGDVVALKNKLSNSFYNVFETLLRENGGTFNKYELEAFANIFDVTTGEVIEFLNNLMDLASRLITKSDRTMEEDIDIKMLRIDMERFRINMLRYILDALGEMARDMSDEVIEKYDGVFIIESRTFGGR